MTELQPHIASKPELFQAPEPMPDTPVSNSITGGDFLTEVKTAQTGGYRSVKHSHYGTQAKIPPNSNQTAKPHSVSAARR